ncbi:thiamine pyrophosphate-binding protein [Streptomyces iconiensis]|uniref:Thiamine pyrophosphate-binding protein n=1 Tax=Streptomyces iconiensis TaxID=1384038 RepID=A0ABT7A5C3_9ACTN|nr:thiamine pyrophosphate-binding protein [Streptomyces iconiensis]MDJ1136548.1 thiamine pyrophosphate-binding protein [Streptomyces iconiensis]
MSADTHADAGDDAYPTAWDAVADHLHHLGVSAVFGLPGDDMGPLAALEKSALPVVLCRDQRNAAFMATGHALTSGRPAVCVIGKGPALTNTLTGLLEARSAAAPVLLVAEGTALGRVGTGAFQEVDQLAAVRPHVKWAARADLPEQLPRLLDKAAAVAVNGTPGPVYVEVAEQLAQSPVPRTAWRPATRQRPAPDPAVLAETAGVIARARRPLLLVGGGARHSGAGHAVELLAERIGAGIFTTASGRGSVDENHPLSCGVSGLYCVPPADTLWQDCDLVLALGSRLEETATFGWPPRGQGGQDRQPTVVQVTLGEESVVTDGHGHHVLADVAHTVEGWLHALPERGPGKAEAAGDGAGDGDGVRDGAGDGVRDGDSDGWRGRVRAVRQGLAEGAAARTGAALLTVREGTVPVSQVLASLDRTLPGDRILVQENGLQDMWSYFFPHWTVGREAGSLVPSEQTPLGFGAAAAMGAALAAPGRPVAALVGDGAFHLMRAELPTLAASSAPVLYVVLDNGGYGWLQSNLDRVSGAGSRFAFTSALGTGTEGIARANGLGHRRVDRLDGLDPALLEAWRLCESGTSAIVEVSVGLEDTPPGVDQPAGDFPTRDKNEGDYDR